MATPQLIVRDQRQVVSMGYGVDNSMIGVGYQPVLGGIPAPISSLPTISMDAFCHSKISDEHLLKITRWIAAQLYAYLSSESLNSKVEAQTSSILDLHRRIYQFFEVIRSVVSLTGSEMVHAVYLLDLLIQAEKTFFDSSSRLISEASLGTILLITVVLVLKLEIDTHPQNGWWAKLIGIPVSVVNQSEIAFLHRVNFNLTIHLAEFTKVMMDVVGVMPVSDINHMDSLIQIGCEMRGLSIGVGIGAGTGAGSGTGASAGAGASSGGMGSGGSVPGSVLGSVPGSVLGSVPGSVCGLGGVSGSSTPASTGSESGIVIRTPSGFEHIDHGIPVMAVAVPVPVVSVVTPGCYGWVRSGQDPGRESMPLSSATPQSAPPTVWMGK
ncbi:uncharacterized protein MONOS_17581 [Monocercomonoides exilis]|uniref:uncharacterized protein n=1 Tax=Monocercomonoides exilis TaxID=2049356 RepID=UPI003559BAD0|nr:hypothetical protein MONOS_17581 [Monocercomonoides exilis]